MRRIGAVLFSLAFVAACQKTSPPVPKSGSRNSIPIPQNFRGKTDVVIRPDVPNILDSSALGTALGPDGTVGSETTSITAGQPVYLTVKLKESPPGLNTGVIWYGTDGKAIERERRAMNGSKVATFAYKGRLKPGRYRVEGYWGGNVIADKSFEVAAGR